MLLILIRKFEKFGKKKRLLANLREASFLYFLSSLAKRSGFDVITI